MDGGALALLEAGLVDLSFNEVGARFFNFGENGLLHDLGDVGPDHYGSYVL